MPMPPERDDRGTMMRLRGRECRVRFWTHEEWGRVAPAERPGGAFSYGLGWADVQPTDGLPMKPIVSVMAELSPGR